MIRGPGRQVPNDKAGKHASKFRLLARRLHHDFRYNMTNRQRSGLVAYLSFVVTIGAVRGLTTAIRTQRLPLHDITAGDVHPPLPPRNRLAHRRRRNRRPRQR
jgi:hypothetical protein